MVEEEEEGKPRQACAAAFTFLTPSTRLSACDMLVASESASMWYRRYESGVLMPYEVPSRVFESRASRRMKPLAGFESAPEDSITKPMVVWF